MFIVLITRSFDFVVKLPTSAKTLVLCSKSNLEEKNSKYQEKKTKPKHSNKTSHGAKVVNLKNKAKFEELLIVGSQELK